MLFYTRIIKIQTATQKQYKNQWLAYVDELYKVGFNLGTIEEADEMAGIISRVKELIKVAAQRINTVEQKAAF